MVQNRLEHSRTRSSFESPEPSGRFITFSKILEHFGQFRHSIASCFRLPIRSPLVRFPLLTLISPNLSPAVPNQNLLHGWGAIIPYNHHGAVGLGCTVIAACMDKAPLHLLCILIRSVHGLGPIHIHKIRARTRLHFF